jgi:hypothetical protein
MSGPSTPAALTLEKAFRKCRDGREEEGERERERERERSGEGAVKRNLHGVRHVPFQAQASGQASGQA